MYSPLVIDHFQHPRNVGSLPQANAMSRVENPACGDLLKIDIRLENDIIQEARFSAQGCAPTIACASRLTEMVQGATVGEALRIDRASLIASLGGLPAASGHAAQLSVDALRSALKSVAVLAKER